jgi:hypothetical protein
MPSFRTFHAQYSCNPFPDFLRSAFGLVAFSERLILCQAIRFDRRCGKHARGAFKGTRPTDKAGGRRAHIESQPGPSTNPGFVLSV